MAELDLNHAFVSAKSDGPDVTLVRPSNWNADHKFTGGTDGDVLTRDSSAANGAKWDTNVPPGSIVVYAGAAAPTGWSLCDGTAVSRTTFATLFAAIGTVYGVGDGTTTFNLPNLKGRVPVGLDAAQTEFDALAETGGAKTHTLTTTEMPTHSHGVTDPTHAHSISDPGHSHTIPVGGGNDGNFVTGAALEGATSTGAAGTGISVVAAGSGISIQNAGSGGAHNNLQPYLTMNFIIKM